MMIEIWGGKEDGLFINVPDSVARSGHMLRPKPVTPVIFTEDGPPMSISAIEHEHWVLVRFCTATGKMVYKLVEQGLYRRATK